ncbi:MAG: orotidine-5'-phosphate decarboxylase [Treponema sp.]|nr:orotidine-5'-phosphate decarboxylase [Treponema sp.]
MNTKHNMQLLQELASKNGPLCVGLDTDPSYIPENILKQYASPAQAVLAYNKAIVERVAAEKSACCCKVQIAYYEAMGLEGMKVYAETLKLVRESGLIAISDIKRGDIGATSDAYAKAHFKGDFETDIITINPYMGFDTLVPFTKYSKPEDGGKGAFVLLCTSNPGMVDVEHQELKAGGLLLEKVGDEIARIGDEWKSIYPEQTCGIFGAVVGATQEKDARYLRDKYANTFFLIPGYGAQGGAARIAATLLDHAGGTVNSSRGILCAWKKDADYAEKMAAGTLTLNDIADAAAKNAIFSKNDLLNAVKEL